jgi:hypothetical protein
MKRGLNQTEKCIYGYMGIYGYIYTYKGMYGYIRACNMGIHYFICIEKYIWVYMGIYAYIMIYIGIYKYKQIPNWLGCSHKSFGQFGIALAAAAEVLENE